MEVGLCAWLYELFPGGVEKIVCKTAQKLKILGHTPTIFCAHHPFSHPTKTFERINGVSTRYTMVPFHPYSFHARFKYHFEKYYIHKTTRLVRHHPCDVFHGMSINALCGTRAKKKTITTIIGLRGNVQEEELLRTADSFVILAEKIRPQLVARGVSESKIHTIYQGVNAASFDYVLPKQDREAFIAKHKLPSDKKFISAIHNFAPKKRTQDLIKAFAQLKNIMKDHHLLLSGIGDTTRIRACIDACGITDQVSFVDVFGDENEVSKVYKVSEFFILPGETFEGDTQIPLVLFEAMCAGVPIIAANVGAVSEVVTPDVGRLVEPSSVSGLSSMMERFVRGEITQFNKQAIVRQGYAYDWQNSVRQLAELYTTL